MLYNRLYQGPQTNDKNRLTERYQVITEYNKRICGMTKWSLTGVKHNY